MGKLDLAVGSPWLLLLLAVVPAMWWIGRKSLADVRGWQALAAIGTRSLIVVLIVLALAETQMRRTSEKVAVIYVLDQSLSIGPQQRRAMFDYVAREVQEHRNAKRGDRAGVVVFGRQAMLEVAPVDADLPWLIKSEAMPAGYADATSLAAALKLAQSALPVDAARRIVVVSDGNENIGAARQIAPQYAAQGIGIDVIAVPLSAQSDVIVEKVMVPASVQRGQPLEARVVIENFTPATTKNPRGIVAGTLRVRRTADQETTTLVEDAVELQPGKNVFPLNHAIDDQPGFYSYEAEFTPADPQLDVVSQNNRATAFTQVRGQGRVLFIESADAPGSYEVLVDRLRRHELRVDVRTTAQLFTSLGELQAYDSVVLADVPRISGDDASTVFTNEQVDWLVRNTEMGAGLVMLGGPHAFGAGGWANTKLEEAMPVDFQIKNAKVVPSGALVLVIDKSGSMAGDKNIMSRRAAVEAINVLSSQDRIGVIGFDSGTRWIVPMQKAEDRKLLGRRVLQMGADGGTDMYPGMALGFSALQQASGAVKHMIVLSDGQTPQADFNGLARKMRQANITVSTIAVGDDADRNLLSQIAAQGGGKYYHVRDARAIPRIFIKEAMRVSKPLVFEREQSFTPQIAFPHEMLRGIDGPLPPINGYVLTQVKDNPLVEVSMVSPVPADERTSTILASWNYGLGRAVAFTTDGGQRWAKPWTEWSGYDDVFTQMIRWSLRPQEEDGKFMVDADVQDGRIRAVITALDQDDEFLNFLSMSGSVIGPDDKATEMRIEQVAPGRYVGEVPVDRAGDYFLAITPAAGKAALRAGVSVPYSAEFRDRQTNMPLLESLAQQTPKGGESGLLLDGDFASNLPSLLTVDTFRPNLPPVISVSDVWPFLAMIAASLFFVDVLLRRLRIDLRAMLPWLSILRRRATAAPAADERMARLKSRTAAVNQELDDRRAAARFEPEAATHALSPDLLNSPDARAGSTQPTVPSSNVTPGRADETTYTERLLKAKQRLRRP